MVAGLSRSQCWNGWRQASERRASRNSEKRPRPGACDDEVFPYGLGASPPMLNNIWFIAAIWMGLALIASLISIRLGISVALIEILVGVVAGNISVGGDHH